MNISGLAIPLVFVISWHFHKIDSAGLSVRFWFVWPWNRQNGPFLCTFYFKNLQYVSSASGADELRREKLSETNKSSLFLFVNCIQAEYKQRLLHATQHSVAKRWENVETNEKHNRNKNKCQTKQRIVMFMLLIEY